MAHVIAVAGKGGVGKSMVTASLARLMKNNIMRNADPVSLRIEKRTCTGCRCRCQFKSE